MNKKSFLIMSLVACFGLQIQASNQSSFDKIMCTDQDKFIVEVVSTLGTILPVVGIAIIGIAAVKFCDIEKTLMSCLFSDTEPGSFDGLPNRK